MSGIGAHGGLAALLGLALPLFFAELGSGVLWSDEADTAVFARTIVRQGLPRAWDGTTFTDSDAGKRVSQGLVMVGTPWLPYYVTAGSFALLGESAFAARLPFALAALGSVALLYALVLRATGDRRAALVAALLLVLSVQFLLYSRECRHYALNVLLSLALIFAFLRLCDGARGAAFVAAAVALFHTHPLPAAATLAGLGGLTLLHRDYRPVLQSFAIRCALVLVLTLPWVYWSWSGWDENSALLTGFGELPARSVQFAWEASVALPWLAWLVLGPLAWPHLGPRDRAWLALVGLQIAAYAALTPLVLHAGQLWMFGLRYVCALLALGAGGSALIAVRASRGRPLGLAAIVAVLGFTHLGANSLPWLWLEPGRVPEPERAAPHVPVEPRARFVRTEWLGLVRELREREPGTVAHVVAALREVAAPGDRVITNYAWEPLAFHTGLPQALKILPGSPIEAAAREAGLPDYVFGVDGARWLVWRWAWDGYQGYRFRDVASAIGKQGGVLEPVARFRETLWENRPEIHFHRFPALGYLYPSSMTVHADRPPRDAELYRIRWPHDAAGADEAP